MAFLSSNKLLHHQLRNWWNPSSRRIPRFLSKLLKRLFPFSLIVAMCLALLSLTHYMYRCLVLLSAVNHLSCPLVFLLMYMYCVSSYCRWLSRCLVLIYYILVKLVVLVYSSLPPAPSTYHFSCTDRALKATVNA